MADIVGEEAETSDTVANDQRAQWRGPQWQFAHCQIACEQQRQVQGDARKVARFRAEGLGREMRAQDSRVVGGGEKFGARLHGCLTIRADMEKEVHPFRLRADGDVFARGTGLGGESLELIAAPVDEPPAAEQFHVIPRWV